jgi:hypothetical protein
VLKKILDNVDLEITQLECFTGSLYLNKVNIIKQPGIGMCQTGNVEEIS